MQEIVLGELEDCYKIYCPKNEKKQKQQKDNKSQKDYQFIYDKAIETIDVFSQQIIQSKFKKLSLQVLGWIKQELADLSKLCADPQKKYQENISVQFALLRVDSANLESVSLFYDNLFETRENDKEIPNECIECTIAFQSESIQINHSLIFYQYKQQHNKNDISNLFNFILENIQHQYSSMADAHTGVFLIYNYLDGEELIDLKKAVLEEIKLRNENLYSNVILILPISETATAISNLEMSKLYNFTPPQKLFIELLLNLIKQPSIPLLPQQIYNYFEIQFNLYTCSFQQSITKIKQAYQQLYSHIDDIKHGKYKTSELFTLCCNNKPSKDEKFSQYLQKRYELKEALDFFQSFLYNLREKFGLQFPKVKERIFQFFSKSTFQNIFTQIPEQYLQDVMDQFHCINHELFDFQSHSIITYLKNQSYINTQQQKQKDRALQLMQSAGYGKSKRELFENYVNQFLNQFVLQNYKSLCEIQKVYCDFDCQEYFKSTSPDILNYYNETINGQKADYFKSLYETYSKLYTQTYIVCSTLKDIRGEFELETTLAELQTLGLIEKTKKIKPTIQRAAFGKSSYMQ